MPYFASIFRPFAALIVVMILASFEDRIVENASSLIGGGLSGFFLVSVAWLMLLVGVALLIVGRRLLVRFNRYLA